MKIFQLWVVLNSCVFMMLYFMVFLRLKYSKPYSVFICIAATIMSTTTEFFRIQFAFDAMWPKLAATVANILIVQSTAMILSEKKDSYVLFIGFSASNFVLAGNITSCAVLLATQNKVAAMASCTLINAAVFACICLFIGEVSKNAYNREISIWMCIIPAMCYITSYLQLYFPVSFEKNPESLLAGGALLVTVVVMYVLFLRYIGSKSKETELLLRNKELHSYIQGMELQADAAESAIHDFQVMRHDMRHKDHLLTELLHEKKYKEAEQVLYKDIESLDRIQMVRYSENVVINGILLSMVKRAKNQGIQPHISCAIPKHQDISDYDLAMLIANLFDNAIQAAAKLEKEARMIALTLKNRTGENFFMEMKNSCLDVVKFSPKTGLPLSGQGEGHGFGMLSVRGFVDKYHAQFDCYQEGETFIVRILIPFL